MKTSFRFWICLLAASACAWQDTSKRITLDVVANDKSGQPVGGLGQQDFTIFDNKQAQPILSFEAKTDSSSGEIVIVMDSVNTGYSRAAYGREQIKKFLQRDAGRLAEPVSIGFFSDSGLKMQETASRDGNALADEINQNASGLRSIGRAQGFYGATDRLRISLNALNELITFESKRAGRKIVIWVSPGWPLLSGPRVEISGKEQQRIFDTVASVSTQLRQSSIALYDVSPLGTDQNLSSENYYRQFIRGVRNAREVAYGDLGLQVLAVQSGGRVLNANNDLAGEMEQCFRDFKNYYVLSFAAMPGEKANEYHAIEVKIDRPGIKAQTRAGYYTESTDK